MKRATAEDDQTRAGLLASEFSLIGLGAGLLLAAALMQLGSAGNDQPAGRETAVVAAGLLTLGGLLALAGWWWNLGDQRNRAPHLAQTLPFLLGFAALGALGAGLAAGLPWPTQSHTAAWLPGPTLLAVVALASGVPLLAVLGLRALAVGPGRPPLPLLQLLQASAHTLAGGAAVLLVLAAAADRLTVAARNDLTSAVGLLCGHALFWSGGLLAGWRHLRRGQPPRPPTTTLERVDVLAGAVALLGLGLPGLVLANALLSGRETGLLAACAVAAASNHVMRYAWAMAHAGP
ncbi:MAG: hypothetical protein HY902_21160 [Deltaproteobacteria bacterium]|nr:hypothetical protein [Deltaproteobacteria bacterium]